MFLDDLLTSYQQMESSFTKNLYQLYKGFEFRTLWNVEDTLLNHQRLAVEAAPGTGQLRGVLELTSALLAFNTLETKTRQCFTTFRYATNTHKWSFDNVKNPAVSVIFIVALNYGCSKCLRSIHFVYYSHCRLSNCILKGM